MGMCFVRLQTAGQRPSTVLRYSAADEPAVIDIDTATWKASPPTDYTKDSNDTVQAEDMIYAAAHHPRGKCSAVMFNAHDIVLFRKTIADGKTVPVLPPGDDESLDASQTQVLQIAFCENVWTEEDLITLGVRFFVKQPDGSVEYGVRVYRFPADLSEVTEQDFTSFDRRLMTNFELNNDGRGLLWWQRGAVSLIDVDSGETTTQFTVPSLQTIAHSPVKGEVAWLRHWGTKTRIEVMSLDAIRRLCVRRDTGRDSPSSRMDMDVVDKWVAVDADLTRLRYSHDSAHLLVCEAARVLVYNTDTLDLVATIETDCAIVDALFTPDDMYIVTQCADYISVNTAPPRRF